MEITYGTTKCIYLGHDSFTVSCSSEFEETAAAYYDFPCRSLTAEVDGQEISALNRAFRLSIAAQISRDSSEKILADFGELAEKNLNEALTFIENKYRHSVSDARILHWSFRIPLVKQNIILMPSNTLAVMSLHRTFSAEGLTDEELSSIYAQLHEYGIAVEMYINKNIYGNYVERILSISDSLVYQKSDFTFGIPEFVLNDYMKNNHFRNSRELFLSENFFLADRSELHNLRDVFLLRSNYLVADQKKGDEIHRKLATDKYKCWWHIGREEADCHYHALSAFMELDAHALSKTLVRHSSMLLYKYLMKNEVRYEQFLLDQQNSIIFNDLNLLKLKEQEIRIKPDAVKAIHMIEEEDRNIFTSYQEIRNVYKSHIDRLEAVKESRDSGKLETILGILTLLTLISVFQDGYDYIRQTGEGVLNRSHFMVSLVILCAGFFIYVSNRNMISYNKASFFGIRFYDLVLIAALAVIVTALMI